MDFEEDLYSGFSLVNIINYPFLAACYLLLKGHKQRFPLGGSWRLCALISVHCVFSVRLYPMYSLHPPQESERHSHYRTLADFMEAQCFPRSIHPAALRGVFIICGHPRYVHRYDEEQYTG